MQPFLVCLNLVRQSKNFDMVSDLGVSFYTHTHTHKSEFFKEVVLEIRWVRKKTNMLPAVRHLS
jgi:hypothetical protein